MVNQLVTPARSESSSSAKRRWCATKQGSRRCS